MAEIDARARRRLKSAEEHLRQGRHEQAEADFVAALKLVPEHPEALIRAGALIANLDLVVSIDTAVLHLAGARWLIDREDSPWYPTMRIFRQPARGDWDPVFRRVRDELARLAAQRVGTAAE